MHLPIELIVHILSYLSSSHKDLSRVSQVDHSLCQAAQDDSLWAACIKHSNSSFWWDLSGISFALSPSFLPSLPLSFPLSFHLAHYASLWPAFCSSAGLIRFPFRPLFFICSLITIHHSHRAEALTCSVPSSGFLPFLSSLSLSLFFSLSLSFFPETF